MPELQSQNRAGEQEPAAGRAQETVPAYPSYSGSVNVRTLASDLESMAQTGGGSPRPKIVTIASLTKPLKAPPGVKPEARPESKSTSKKTKYWLWFSFGLFGLLAVFLSSYFFLYPLFFKPVARQTASSTLPYQPKPQVLKHQSFFSQAADQTLILKLSEVSSNLGLRAYQPQFQLILGGSNSSSSFFEIVIQDSQGRPMPFSEFLSAVDARVFTADFLNTYFNPDFTMFLYKDKTGFWPGYALQLRTPQSPLFFQNDLQNFEQASSNWPNLFISQPGAVASAGFQDNLILSQPIRVLNLSNPSSTLSYGWFFNNKYLVLSTSLDGLKQALQHF